MKQILALFLLIACAQFAVSSEVALPSLPERVYNNQVVLLPPHVQQAEQLLFAWNAQVSSEQYLSLNVVPRLDQIYTDKKIEAHFKAWRLADRVQMLEHAKQRFDLSVDDRYPGVICLLVPHEVLAQRIQHFVNNTCLSMSIAVPTINKSSSAEISISNGIKKIAGNSGLAQLSWSHYVMIVIGMGLLYLAIAKGFEPLLLLPIAAGCIFVNAGGAGMGEPGGLLHYFYTYGIETAIFPLLIFLGVGALTDFGPLLANPWSALLGAAAQFGIFGSFFLAVSCFGFSMEEAAAIAIIGGADGPTSIFVASKLAPDLLGAIAVAAYSYMALVPIIQPPIMRALTNEYERKIMMTQRRVVSRRSKILFPIIVIILCMLCLPDAVPLIGMLMLGNLMKESGVVDRLSKTAQNELINIVTIGLGLSVGMKMSAEKFLIPETLGILFIGIIAFMMGTAAGVLLAKLMSSLSGGKVNPLIGAAGVSAVPMAARVAQNEGTKYNKSNFLLMHAMGPNVAGVIGSAVAAGILLSLLG